jgi:outer membrane protein OmpA-like peptidoglycan-associated protein
MARATIILAFMVTGILAGGCATPAPAPAPPIPVDTSRTTVVLLPDEDGNVGAVSVTTPDGSQKVDTAYSFTTVDGAHSRPSELQLMGEERVNVAFADVIKAQPPKPKSVILYFVLDSTALTAESKTKLPALFEAVRERKPTEISIFGHTDAIGTQARNVKLSAERAKAVENILRKRDPDLGNIEVQFFGSQEPLVPSAPHAPEPRNRRAEIMIL